MELSTCCHVGHHVDFSFIQISLAPEAFKVKYKVNLNCLRLLDQSYNLYITGQGPSSCSVKVAHYMYIYIKKEPKRVHQNWATHSIYTNYDQHCGHMYSFPYPSHPMLWSIILSITIMHEIACNASYT